MKYHVLGVWVLAAVLGAAIGCSDDIEPTHRDSDDGGDGGDGGASNGPGGGGMSTTGGHGGDGGGGMGGAGGGGAPSGVVINEVAADGDPRDWIELKNLAAGPADISGWYFTDNDPQHIYTFPEGTTLPSNGYFTVDRAAGTAGPDEFDFGFDNAGDEMHLYDAADVEMDGTSWREAITTPATWGRSPDGTGGFGVVAQESKGTANP